MNHSYFISIDLCAGLIVGLVGIDFIIWATGHVIFEILSNSQNWIRMGQTKPSYTIGKGDTLLQSQMDNLMAFAGWLAGDVIRRQLILAYYTCRRRLNNKNNSNLLLQSTVVPITPNEVAEIE